MKQILPLLLLLLTLELGAQTIFVKQNATGLNNGSSWENAYTSLDVAIASIVTPLDQSIWVAKGTYKPSMQAPSNSFFLYAGLNLYGGFNGTETSTIQRDIAANPTILSGDILGDDITGNFDTLRTDNAQHVLVVFVLTDNLGSRVDGFTFRGGQTLTTSANPDLTRRGGGILANAQIHVNNCTFTDNFGESGAGLAVVDGLGDESSVENCVFEQNKATEDAICFFRNTPTGLVDNCTFKNNLTNRGALYPSNTSAFVIQGCLFENNTGTSFGAGMFTWQSTFTLRDCIFRKNKSPNAAGIYIDGRDGNDLAYIEDCLFENDTVTDFGGAGIYSWQATMEIKNTIFRNNYAPNAAGMYCDGREMDSSYSLDNCTFEGNVATSYGCTSIWNAQTNFTISNSVFKNNIAPSSGAALYNSDHTIFTVNNTLFEGNKGNYGSCLANYGLGCIGTYDGCTFRNNQATNGGGAASNGFKADVKYKNCNFTSNLASFGGAIFTQNDSTRLSIEDCYFTENNTTGSGGCVYVNPNIATNILRSTFYLNIGEYGGAINASGDSLISIDKCAFLDNIATVQGAALNFNHVNAVLTNSLFARNIDTGTGAGGAISNNSGDNTVSKVKAVNCTFADNVAVIGAGIANWESTLGDAQLTLLNCLLQNPDGDNYGIEEGTPQVFSMNGNQSSDVSLNSYLGESKDLHSTFNAFEDSDNGNYAHTIGSPASDGGVIDGAPMDDFTGAPRYGIPDVGYREVKTTGNHNPGTEVLPLACSPNPASDQTVLTFKNDRNGTVQILVWNQLGQQMAKFSAEKTSSQFLFPLTVQQFASGTYKVQVRLGAIVHEGMFVKL